LSQPKQNLSQPTKKTGGLTSPVFYTISRSKAAF
jgi:hypothetical protein